MQHSAKSPITLASGLLVLALSYIPFGCVEAEDEEEGAEAEDVALPEYRNNPGKGTGSASWTVVSGGNTLVFTMSVSDGIISNPTLVGTPPAFSALPLNVTNSDGETLYIEQQIINGSRYRRYYGSFEISVDSDESASECTECACTWGPAPTCYNALSWTDCSSTSTSCGTTPCGTVGGGIVTLDLDFSSTPGAPW